jgi:ComF family protein
LRDSPIKQKKMLWIGDFLALIYPKICVGCGNSLWRKEVVICHSCAYRLPETGFHMEPDNPVSQLFTGRIAVHSAAAFLLYNKGSRVQSLVHALKYKGRKDVGVYLGKRYGSRLKESPLFAGISLIIPVPLHRKKYMKRGYNQSERFAAGLGSALGIPVDVHNLVRTKATETQTRKSRFRRWENVADIFILRDPERLRGTHILLVDDVITTGATLESCITAFSAVPGIRVSIATIAAAMV